MIKKYIYSQEDKKVKFKKIDMETYNRKAGFEYFKKLAFPYLGVTVNADITELEKMRKEKKLPFFLTILYTASQAANKVPELRRRIDENGDIIEYENCKTSHTVALEDRTYVYCELSSDIPYEEYIKIGRERQEEAKLKNGLEDEEESRSLFFVSSLPWISYTSLTQPVPVPADSNPRITFGKRFEMNGRIYIPLSILAHHGLANGIHIADFYKKFEETAEEIVKKIKS